MVVGYKAFNKDLTNRYGKHFNAGRLYEVDGPVKFGNEGNGFHMCTTLADVFRYVDAINDEVKVAKVIGSGEMVSYNDEYEGYYDMYACSKMYVSRFLSREEILFIICSSSNHDIIKFLRTYKLNEKELEFMVSKFKDNPVVYKGIMYYQYGHKDVYDCNCDMKLGR